VYRPLASVFSVKKAILGKAALWQSSSVTDGLHLIGAEEREERIASYANYNIGWIARPRHLGVPDGFKRAGKFKKPSNMNYGLGPLYLLRICTLILMCLWCRTPFEARTFPRQAAGARGERWVWEQCLGKCRVSADIDEARAIFRHQVQRCSCLAIAKDCILVELKTHVKLEPVACTQRVILLVLSEAWMVSREARLAKEETCQLSVITSERLSMTSEMNFMCLRVRPHQDDRFPTRKTHKRTQQSLNAD
jgi:hypothetical protein